MADLIHQLPDSIANQIAAGEVVKRPASVVKELMENALDAEATEIIVNIKDAGKTLIQITDNGKGMSELDARMAFERHATSKIKTIDDLFRLHTMGFRGEALASIAAIAQVEMHTCQKENTIGTKIIIEGSKLITQEPVATSAGTTFFVKNLFFNVPVRRKFLKSDTTESNYITQEFLKIAIANPQVAMQLTINGKQHYNLHKENLKKRLSSIFRFGKNLLPIEEHTQLINVTGFIGKPEDATKQQGRQYFFVNGRYFKHLLFYRSIMDTYKDVIRSGYYPAFFIFFEVPPESIDVNIHPTKTEIKFENEQHVMQILRSIVRKSIGNFNITPSLDFSQTIQLPLTRKGQDVETPKISFTPNYVPDDISVISSPSKVDLSQFDDETKSFEEKIPVSDETSLNIESTFFENTETVSSDKFLLYKNKYILTSVKSGLMVVDYKRAMERIHFEYYMAKYTKDSSREIQTLLYPIIIEMKEPNEEVIAELIEFIKPLGFDANYQNENLHITATPPFLEAEKVIHTIIADFYNTLQEHTVSDSSIINRLLSQELAYYNAQTTAVPASQEEMETIINRLFQCEYPSYDSKGQKIVSILDDDFLLKIFN